jgi:uncharacterized protein
VKIHLPSYPQGVHQIIEDIEPRNLELDSEIFVAPIQTLLNLDRHDPYLQFEFSLQTSVRLTCDRCLTDFQQLLTVRTPMLYVMGRSAATMPEDETEVVFVSAGLTDLDISADLRDFLILALPEKRLCRDDCKSLCPGCGADLNTQICSCGMSLQQEDSLT